MLRDTCLGRGSRGESIICTPTTHAMHEENMIESWNKLGSTFYERRTSYIWEKCKTGRVASAHNGGPVAVVLDASSANVVQVCVFNAAGHQLSRIAYEAGSTLLEFGWTRKEVRDRLCVESAFFFCIYLRTSPLTPPSSRPRPLSITFLARSYLSVFIAMAAYFNTTFMVTSCTTLFR